MHWTEWTYSDWNERLLEHVFIARGAELNDPVERIPATAEELLSVVGDLSAEAGSVQDAFVRCVRGQLPYGVAFSGFCFNYGAWTPASPMKPRFFGMLWFSCLVAYGYPNPELGFYPRVWEALGKTDNLQYQDGPHHPSCLPVLWDLLRQWTVARRAAGMRIRELLLPSDVGRRTAMGFSWFLAFPHQLDRLELSRSLWDAQLVGPEPPIEPVVAALQARRDRFSREFREDLDDFVQQVLRGSGEAKVSAFWRAVRQEALHPSATSDGRRLETKPQAGIVVFETDEGLRPLLCGPAEWQGPPGYDRVELEEPVGTLTHYFAKAGDLSEPAERALVLGELVGFAHRNLIGQGLLVLRQVGANEYAVVSGTEVNGATAALARDDRRDEFVAEFGGSIAPGLVDGWWEITRCRVRKLAVLPPGLAGATQLLATMQPPIISIVGGIRVPEGFYKFGAYLPHVHAFGAERVWVDHEGEQVPCSPMPDEGEWSLPNAAVPARGDVVIRAEWPHNGGSARTAEARASFVDWVLDDRLRPLRSGKYIMEGCGDPEVEITGGTPVIPEARTTDESASTDLIELDGSVRFLGAGVGEMSLAPSPNFQWMVIGASKDPDYVVYVGDPNTPAPPANRRSPDNGDRRHWKRAFAATPLVRTSPGRYERVDAFPQVQKILADYRRHQATNDAEVCPPTDLRALQAPGGLVDQADAKTQDAIEALIALSVRKGGLGYKEVATLLEPLVGTNNPFAVQHVLRAWSESGLLDVVRHVVSGHLTIVAAQPALLRVRRGPEVEATVLGVLSEHRLRRLLNAVTEIRRVRHVEVKPPNPFQPCVHRLRGALQDVDLVAERSGIASGGWLEWPNPAVPPRVFDVQLAYERLRTDPPPPSYRLNAVWDWDKLTFDRRRTESSNEGVEIQRRVHNDGTSFYVVLSDGTVACRSYLRSWALLFGYELAGRPPFRRDSRDSLSCVGQSPVHLPLPIARLCAVVGAGLPGPQFRDRSVLGYSYPFGSRLYRLIDKVIPKQWVQRPA